MYLTPEMAYAAVKLIKGILKGAKAGDEEAIKSIRGLCATFMQEAADVALVLQFAEIVVALSEKAAEQKEQQAKRAQNN